MYFKITTPIEKQDNLEDKNMIEPVEINTEENKDDITFKRINRKDMIDTIFEGTIKKLQKESNDLIVIIQNNSKDNITSYGSEDQRLYEIKEKIKEINKIVDDSRYIINYLNYLEVGDNTECPQK